ncbi:MAG: T9SS type A sorting domain-containing protein [Chitinophagales bacterium]
MKHIFALLLTALCMLTTIAQDEYLAPTGSNAKLYYNTIPYQNTSKTQLIDQNIIITSDTLTLPFVDDFSSNTLRSYDFDMNITSTVDRATGSCVINSDFDYENKGFHFTQGYSYSYDTLTDMLDSVATLPVTLTIFENIICFPTPTSTVSYWEPYYISTVADFDTITGIKLDSTLSVADTLIDVATIHFANLDTDSKWADNYAHWNTTYPILPPTLGVATLDGLDQFGLPYNNSVQNAYGDADVLTSKPINLSGLANDSAVYLSFFYQAKGLGDMPDDEDSLVVEFRNEFDGSWKTVWSLSSVNANTDFTQVYVEVRDTALVEGPHYFYEEFQFRFRNKASLSGNNDHWHIDYVRLDKGRNPMSVDSVIRDVAFLYDAPNFLTEYSQLPWRQLQAGADSFTNEISIPIRDNGQVESIAAGAFPINYYIDNTQTNDTIFKLEGLNFNPTQEIKYQDFAPDTDFTLPVFSSDSVCARSLLYVSPIDRNTLFNNDTTRSEICFTDVLAYDDGSAERAYGIEGGTNDNVKKFAYEFNLAQEDTLAAIQIHFSNIDQNVDNLIFSFFVWDSIQLSGVSPYENILSSIENQKPTYIDMHNGFATYAFDSAIVVNDKFYIGWAQTDNRNLQIGYDLNSTKGHDNMFVFSNNQWNQSSIQLKGSPMLRALLDADFAFDTTTTGIFTAENKVKEINVYPNPTTGLLQIDVPQEVTNYQVQVIDLLGRLVAQANNEAQINLHQLTNGTYVLRLVDNDTQTQYLNRVIKQ